MHIFRTVYLLIFRTDNRDNEIIPFAGFLVRDGIESQIDAAAAVVGMRYNGYTVGFSYGLKATLMASGSERVNYRCVYR